MDRSANRASFAPISYAEPSPWQEHFTEKTGSTTEITSSLDPSGDTLRRESRWRDNETEDQRAARATFYPPHHTLWAWRWEIVALFLAIAILAAVFITLASYNGREYPSWQYGISLTSLVAIYTTILRALLLVPVAEGKCLFPNASC
jgi:hypothetical protein